MSRFGFFIFIIIIFFFGESYSYLVCINVESERAQRERLRDLAVFERLNRNPALSSPSLAVKKVSFFRCCVFVHFLSYLIKFKVTFFFFH